MGRLRAASGGFGVTQILHIRGIAAQCTDVDPDGEVFFSRENHDW